MCMLKMQVTCSGKFFEVSPDEVENAELAVEEAVSSVLIHLFGTATVDDVAICFAPRLYKGARLCSIQIQAECACQQFTLLPPTRRNMELAVGRSMRTLLKELFGSINVERVMMRPTSLEAGSDPALSCCV
jgi:hypothetical protein